MKHNRKAATPGLSAGATGLLLALPFPLFLGICMFSAQFGNAAMTGSGGLFLVQVLCCEFGPCFSVLLIPWQAIYIYKGIRNDRSVLAWVALVPAAVPWVYFFWALAFNWPA